MPQDHPQQSQVHESTADASTSPTSAGDEQTTRQTPGASGGETPKLNPEPPRDVRVVSDDTDSGGPLTIESADPDLNPPQAPTDPFPTDGTPQVDPDVPKPRTAGNDAE